MGVGSGSEAEAAVAASEGQGKDFRSAPSPGSSSSSSSSSSFSGRPSWPPREAFVAQQLKDYARRGPRNERSICDLPPEAFSEQVLLGELSRLAMDGGDSVQPLYKKVEGLWLLSALEVLYRFRSADSVPYPAFVNFVRAASDQSASPREDLRASFRSHALRSLRRVDARLSLLDHSLRSEMVASGLLTTLNFTAKQLEAAVAQPLHNPELIGLEETEYDDEPASLSELRHKAWLKFGMLSLDDVQPTLVQAYASAPLAYSPPRTPAGGPFKPLASGYRHDLAFARRFVEDFRRAREGNPSAKASLKFSEEFCLYLLGVGYAPFSRASMAAWREENPEASEAVRKAGVELIRAALDAGMDLCLEVSFDDAEVEWLLEEVPELEGRMSKQGGLSGPIALPYSMVEKEILSLPGSVPEFDSTIAGEREDA